MGKSSRSFLVYIILLQNLLLFANLHRLTFHCRLSRSAWLFYTSLSFDHLKLNQAVITLLSIMLLLCRDYPNRVVFFSKAFQFPFRIISCHMETHLLNLEYRRLVLFWSFYPTENYCLVMEIYLLLIAKVLICCPGVCRIQTIQNKRFYVWCIDLLYLLCEARSKSKFLSLHPKFWSWLS